MKTYIIQKLPDDETRMCVRDRSSKDSNKRKPAGHGNKKKKR